MTTNAVTDRGERFRALPAQGLVVMPNASGTYSYLDSAVPGTELEKALAAGGPRD